jgi:hypothetical protein
MFRVAICQSRITRRLSGPLSKVTLSRTRSIERHSGRRYTSFAGLAIYQPLLGDRTVPADHSTG